MISNKRVFFYINWVLSGICFLFWVLLLIKNEFWGFSIPVILGSFLGAMFPSGLLWLIYWYAYSVHSDQPKPNHKTNTVNDFDNQKSKILELVKNSVFTEEEGKQKIEIINERIRYFENEKFKIHDNELRLKKFQIDKENLEELKGAGLVSAKEYAEKFEKIKPYISDRNLSSVNEKVDEKAWSKKDITLFSWIVIPLVLLVIISIIIEILS